MVRVRLAEQLMKIFNAFSTLDYVQFKNIVTDAMRDRYDTEQDAIEYAESKWKLFGQDFLNACIEQKTSR